MEEPSTDQMVKGLIDISASLSSDSSLKERMIAVCRNVAEMLDCDRSSIYVWDGQRYQGTYYHGIPDHLVPNFQSREAGDAMAPLAELKTSFIVAETDAINKAMPAASHDTALISLVLCPISNPEGEPLAILTAGFSERIGEFDPIRAQIVVGTAGLVKVALMAEEDQDVSRRSISNRRNLSLEIDRSEEERRQRVRREIHGDSMNQMESLHNSLAELATAAPEPEIVSSLQSLVAESAAAAESLSQMLGGESLDVPRESDLATSLMSTIHHYSIVPTFRTELVNNLKLDPQESVKRELLQIARQAMSNSELHAHAESVVIEIGTERRGTKLSVTDDGIGFEPTAVPSDRFGLLSMKERAESIGGVFTIESSLGEGTKVSVWIPHKLD